MKKRSLRRELMLLYNRLHNAFGWMNWWPAESPLEMALGAILTQNAAWHNAEAGVRNLKEAGLIDIQALHRFRLSEIARHIRPSGFFHIKAKRIKAFVSFVIEHYEGSLSKMFEEDQATLRNALLGIHGIGPETADNIILYGAGKPVFAIDAYTKRVMVRHGLAEPGSTYDELQKIFMENLPCKVGLYKEFRALLVELGKRHCRPKPRCTGCPLEGYKVQ